MSDVTGTLKNATKQNVAFTEKATYYWRVRAHNSAGWGPNSDVWHFTIGDPVTDTTNASIQNVTVPTAPIVPGGSKARITWDVIGGLGTGNVQIAVSYDGKTTWNGLDEQAPSITF